MLKLGAAWMSAVKSKPPRELCRASDSVLQALQDVLQDVLQDAAFARDFFARRCFIEERVQAFPLPPLELRLAVIS